MDFYVLYLLRHHYKRRESYESENNSGMRRIRGNNVRVLGHYRADRSRAGNARVPRRYGDGGYTRRETRRAERGGIYTVGGGRSARVLGL